MSELNFGVNVENLLHDLSQHESSDIGDFDVYGEDEQGREGCASIDITLLASDALKVISTLKADHAGLLEKFNFKENLTEQIVALQKQCDALAAENVALKSVFNPDNLPEEAVDAVNSAAQFDWDSNDCGSWTWVVNDDEVAKAVIRAIASPETPATDAYLNSVRAEGIHFAANRMLAAWESGFIDDTPAQVHDISGAVLSALEFLPNASPEEFKRDYADEVRSAIANQLRAGKDGE